MAPRKSGASGGDGDAAPPPSGAKRGGGRGARKEAEADGNVRPALPTARQIARQPWRCCGALDGPSLTARFAAVASAQGDDEAARARPGRRASSPAAAPPRGGAAGAASPRGDGAFNRRRPQRRAAPPSDDEDDASDLDADMTPFMDAVIKGARAAARDRAFLAAPTLADARAAAQSSPRTRSRTGACPGSASARQPPPAAASSSKARCRPPLRRVAGFD
jgi:hypothetical protein